MSVHGSYEFTIDTWITINTSERGECLSCFLARISGSLSWLSLHS